MKTKELKIKIPDSLKEITLEQYQSVQKLEGSETYKATNTIAILCDMDISDVKNLQVEDFNSISVTLTKTMNMKSIFRQRFKIGEVEYGLIPNFDDMTIGEYIDLDTFIRKTETIHKAMAVLYRPIIIDKFGKYRIEDYKEDVDFDIMLNTPMDIVNGTMVFFLNLSKELLKHMPQYLVEEQADKHIQYKQTLTQSGDGIQVYINSLMNNMETLKA